MRRNHVVLAAILLFFCHWSVEASVTEVSSDTPVSIAASAGGPGSPVESTISFPVSGTITDATVEVALDVGACGSGALTLSGPGGMVTIMKATNSGAGNIFALVDDNAPGADCEGDCLNGCGTAGSPEPCVPTFIPGTPMSTFDGQISDATDWTLTLVTVTGGCGPWSINSWSLTLEGPVELIFEDGFETGNAQAWSSSTPALP